MLSRLEEGGKIIIIMTRWATNDLSGKAISHFQEEGKKIKVIIKKALQDNGEMLCDEVLSHSSYKSKIRAMGEDIASANYQQVPIDLKGRLYQNFMTYDILPTNFTSIISYCDTADEGKDYLCNVIAGIHNKQAYILDVYYTKDGMEITEEETARRIYTNRVDIAHFESNSGGRSFARNVKIILMKKYKSNYTVVKWFHQSKNKIARIISNSTWIMNNMFFPNNWKNMFPEYYLDMCRYQKEGKNKHDDAPDATTGIAEKTERALPNPITSKKLL
jgi:predicted phage terminase large subunit-like protein